MTTSETSLERSSTNKQLKLLTIVGYTEGCSFLLLLGIAMPLKYVMGFPAAVKWIGMAHGILFLGYLVILLIIAIRVKLPLWALPGGVIAAVMPFGPFVFDHLLKKQTTAG